MSPRKPSGPTREDHVGDGRPGGRDVRTRPRSPTGRDDIHPVDDHLILTAVRGLEAITAEEAAEHGLPGATPLQGAVRVPVDPDQRVRAAMRACLWMRTAEQVILPLARARIRRPGDLAPALAAMSLAPHFGPDHTLAVEASIRRDNGPPPHLLALRVKDAIVDQLRDAHGRRPFVDTEQPDIAVHADLDDQVLTIGLRLHHEPLHRRGYRQHGGPAPVRETIAAALIRFSGWDRRSPLCDPLCGSGTLPIEAAGIAARIAPGEDRPWGFLRWPTFPEHQADWDALLKEARDLRKPSGPPIFARDADPRAVAATRRHVVAAGLQDRVFVSQADVSALAPLDPAGTFVANPPWGERLGEGELEQAREVHRTLGHAARDCPEHRLAVLSMKKVIAGTIPMRPDAVLPFRNGPLACQFSRYLVQGPPAADPSPD
ncbi:MAG: hypothetical protein EA398_16665 [Deltaproteobacteria bacterium]|nr:MAG: hypothetical protein EA398_16665 [Deltaproteobacteria bacterium]